jgi:AraC-like DNA-binding protein
VDHRNESTGTSWSYYPARTSATALPPGCDLGGFSERAPAPVHRLEVPVSPGVLVLCCGEPITLKPAAGSGPAARFSAFFAGLQVGAQLASHAGSNDCVEMQLPPSAAYALFGGVVTEANRDPVNLLDADPLGIGVLLDQLQTESTWQRRFAAVDGFLARRFAESERRIPPEVGWAWSVLERAHGQVTTAALAHSVGWSERHFTDRFRAFFGVRPKTAARRLRFARAFSLVAGRPLGELAAIAVEVGFSDQSHMTREFGVFAGASPAALRRARFADLPGIPATVLSDG